QRGQVAAGELTGPGWSLEDRALRAGALQLVEAWEGGHRDHPVPEPPSILALRGRGDHRAEERGAVERHHRGADLLSDQGDAGLVRLPQGLVQLIGVGVPDQLGRQADLSERLDEHLTSLVAATARVEPGADRVVERLD